MGSFHHNLSYTSKQAKHNELFSFFSKDTPITFFSGGNFRPYELDCVSAFLKQHDVYVQMCVPKLWYLHIREERAVFECSMCSQDNHATSNPISDMHITHLLSRFVSMATLIHVKKIVRGYLICTWGDTTPMWSTCRERESGKEQDWKR